MRAGRKAGAEPPAPPPIEPLVVVVPGQALVSGNLSVSCLSIASLICCAVCGGLSAPLLITTEPSPVEFVTVMVGPLVDATQPGGTGIDSADVDVVPVPPAVGDVDRIGLGVPAGDGLGKTSALV